MSDLPAPRMRRTKISVGADGLIDVAESLFAQRGFDAVSMRQIAAAAGLANPFSVQYHFGDIDGLLRAIFTTRLPQIDARRASLLRDLEEAGAPSVEGLLDCLFRPFSEAYLGFAYFLSRVLRSPEQRSFRAQFDSLAPTSHLIYARIAPLLPDVPADILGFRMTAANLIVADMLATPDAIAPASIAELPVDQRYRIALKAAVGCLAA